MWEILMEKALGFEQKHVISFPVAGFSSGAMLDMSLKLTKLNFLSIKEIY